MESSKKLIVVLSVLFYSSCHAILENEVGDYRYNIRGIYRPEMFFGKNISLLNNNNEADKIWFQRHIIDFSLNALWGCPSFEKPGIELLFVIRNKSVWGNASVASTSDAESRLLDAVGRPHRHFIPLHLFWMREGWMRLDLSTLLGLNLEHRLDFTLGAFAFQLGRGIALGDAFATGPGILGFWTDFNVDQYAFGAKLSGEILTEKLAFDLYAAILNNRSSSITLTAANIRGQEYGRRLFPLRGFGVINYIIAGRLNWIVFKREDLGFLSIEPYWMFNADPEQQVDFLGDAESRLATLGFAGEYYGSKFEFGWDYAFNLGQQRVFGWDRNQVEEANVDGRVSLVNSEVVDQNGNKIPFVSSTNPAQLIIFTDFQDESQNGQQIGTLPTVGYLTNGPINLINSNRRYRNPFVNRFEGWMFVIDGGWWIYKRDLLFSLGAGIATGDENPNDEEVDGVFSGFIGLQEIYSGKRVKSAFVLGSAGKLPRPLSIPRRTARRDRFNRVVDRFTNLIYAGGSLLWIPTNWCNEFAFQVNMLGYWEEQPTNKFDFRQNRELDERASSFLGVETNVFMHYFLTKSLKIYFVGALFFPGQHYSDILGRPIRAEQAAFLDRLDRTGFSAERVPNIGHDAAFSFNLGLEFRF